MITTSHLGESRKSPNSAPLLCSVGDAMAALSIGRTTLYRLIGEGKIQTLKIGSSTRIVVASLNAFVAERIAA